MRATHCAETANVALFLGSKSTGVGPSVAYKMRVQQVVMDVFGLPTASASTSDWAPANRTAALLCEPGPPRRARVTVDALASIMQYTHDTLQHLERYNGGYAVQLGRLNISRIEHYFSTMRSGEQTLNATRLVVKHQRSQAAATADNLQARADYTVQIAGNIVCSGSGSDSGSSDSDSDSGSGSGSESESYSDNRSDNDV